MLPMYSRKAADQAEETTCTGQSCCYLHGRVMLMIGQIQQQKGRNMGPCNYQKALYTGKHVDLPKSTEKTHARRGLYALWIIILCVLDNKDVYM